METTHIHRLSVPGLILESTRPIFTRTDGIWKFSKAVRSIARLSLLTFAKGSEIANSIIKRFSTVVEFCGAIKLINRIYEWSCIKFNTWQQTVSKIFLTLTNAIETFLWFANLGFYNLRNMAASIPPLKIFLETFFQFLPMAADIFSGASFTFELLDRRKEIDKANDKIKDLKAKIAQWLSRKSSKENSNETISYTRILKTQDVQKIKIDQLEKYIADIREGKIDLFEVKKKYKIELYHCRIKNNEIHKQKAWRTIIADIAKIAKITINLLAAMLSLTNPHLKIGIAVFGALVNSLEVFKIAYEECVFKTIKEPARPFLIC